jgi:hypothetical protein
LWTWQPGAWQQQFDKHTLTTGEGKREKRFLQMLLLAALHTATDYELC